MTVVFSQRETRWGQKQKATRTIFENKSPTEFLSNSLQLGLGARDKNDVHLLGSQLEGKLLANTIGSTGDDYERFYKDQQYGGSELMLRPIQCSICWVEIAPCFHVFAIVPELCLVDFFLPSLTIIHCLYPVGKFAKGYLPAQPPLPAPYFLTWRKRHHEK